MRDSCPRHPLRRLLTRLARPRRDDITRALSSGGADIAAMFLAFLVSKLERLEKEITKGAKKPGDACVQQVSAALYGNDHQQAMLRCRSALLSSIFFVQMHFDFEIRTDRPVCAKLQTAMHRWWQKRLKKQPADGLALGGVATPATSQFATEVHKYVEEKGERLVGERSEGSDPLIALTDQLESVVNVEGVRGLFVPFAVPQQMEEVRPNAPRALATYAGT